MNEMISLSNGEWKIMKLLWQYETMTVGQIVTAMEGDTDWSKNTVFTMLKRLEEKGAVRMLSAKRPQQGRLACSVSAHNSDPVIPEQRV